MTRVARRGFLVGAGGAAGWALGWWLGGASADPASRPVPIVSELPEPSEIYVDRDGWMLTVEDKAALDARPADRPEVDD